MSQFKISRHILELFYRSATQSVLSYGRSQRGVRGCERTSPQDGEFHFRPEVREVTLPKMGAGSTAHTFLKMHVDTVCYTVDSRMHFSVREPVLFVDFAWHSYIVHVECSATTTIENFYLETIRSGNFTVCGIF